MKSISHNIINIFLFFCILIAVFYDYSNRNKIDLKKQIVDFTKFEDSRNLNKVLLFFEFPLLDYWEHKKISKVELTKIYLSYWERFEYSKNEIQKIDKISDYEAVLKTKYIFKKSIASKLNRYRLSETKFNFNKSGKITSISNLSIRKIDNQYILDNNLTSDFSYEENIFLKNNLEIASFFTLLLILNLSIQALTIKKRKKESEKFNQLKDENEQQKLKEVIESNRLIKIKETEKLRQRDLKETTDRELSIKLAKEKIEIEKKRRESVSWENLEAANERQRDLKETSDKELSIKLAKEKIEKEKKRRERIEADKKEAARIKRNKLAKEKREEKKRLEQEKKVKDEARIKREKRVIKKREDEEREKREKKELELNDLNLKQQQELVKSNTEIVDQSEDAFFDDNLSQYITEIPDDDIDDAESDIGDFLTDTYMSQKLKNKLKNK